jgi:succinate dehydrogenase / fumarate reductase, membrane anchor subunit
VKPIFAGLRAWMLQRVTAVAATLLLLTLLIAWLAMPPADFMQWRSAFASPLVQSLVLLFFAVSAAHAWVGVRDITIDYIKPLPARFAVMTLAVAVLAGSMVALAIAFSRLS